MSRILAMARCKTDIAVAAGYRPPNPNLDISWRGIGAHRAPLQKRFIRKTKLGLSLPDKATRLEIYSSPHEQGSK